MARRPARTRRLSKKGLLFIAKWEGYRARAYNDAAGHATIGYGHLLHFGPVNAKDRKLNWSRAKALRVLRRDVARITRGWRAHCKRWLTQYEYDALVAFAFNVGAGALRSSTLLRKLNDGHRLSAANEFPKWVKAGGQTLQGLVNRRREERHIFLGRKYPV